MPGFADCLKQFHNGNILSILPVIKIIWKMSQSQIYEDGKCSVKGGNLLQSKHSRDWRDQLPLCTALQNLYALHCTKSNKSQVSYPPMHLNTPQYTSIHFNTPQYTSIHFNTLQCTSIHFNTCQYISIHFNTVWLKGSATWCMHYKSMYFMQSAPNQILWRDQLPQCTAPWCRTAVNYLTLHLNMHWSRAKCAKSNTVVF